MKFDLKRTGIVMTLLLQMFSVSVASDNCLTCHSELPEIQLDRGISSRAVGVMDKGQLQVNTGNFGDLADFHAWFTNAAHWPRTADDVRQYAFGLGLVVAVNENNVIETVTQAMTSVRDWLPPDDAYGRQYSGDITAVSDDTPFLASSDFRETWPFGYFDEEGYWNSTDENTWPGYFRVDVGHEDFPNTIVEREGEFTSDRDIYCLYNDDQNTRGSVGLTVEQSSYSYGRPYAEDINFWEFNIFNTSGSDLENISLGFFAKFRPDYDWHDYLNFIDTDDDGIKDFVYVYDLDNVLSGVWADTDDPLGMIGLRVFDTPGDIGVTDFHHFARGVNPTSDEMIYALMTSEPNSSYLESPEYYFHGDDHRVDSTDPSRLEEFYPQWLDEESGVELGGDALNFIISCGPVTIPADSMVQLSVGLIMGDSGPVEMAPDTTDLMTNVRMANRMHELYFQGSGPPDPPVVNAVAGDERATLYWQSEPSESSRDVLTGELDFEGYKIFRSTDQGRTWGDEITNNYGHTAGYVPIAIYDLVNDVQGDDPAYPQHLGYNSGLTHTFVDSNLVNGIEYWYCVTAYDRGNAIMEPPEQSYLYPLGSSVFEQHTVAVTPSVGSSNMNDAAVSDQLLQPIGGLCDGIVEVEIVDPDAVTGHGYQISFSYETITQITGSDTTYGLGFTLIDTTTNEIILLNEPLSDESGDNIPVVDGLRLRVSGAEPGIISMGWTSVASDTCTFDWRYQSIDPSSQMMLQEDVSSFDDWRITVDYDQDLTVRWYDAFADEERFPRQNIPLRIELLTDAGPVDATEESWLFDFNIPGDLEMEDFAWEVYRQFYYSPLGWDLEPGGKGYTPGSPGWYNVHVDILALEKIQVNPVSGDTIPNYLYLFTNNKPDSSYTYNADTGMNELVIIDAHAPSQGDQFTIRTRKQFRPGITYTFGTQARGINTAAGSGNPLHDIRVVPDPYIVTNVWETSEFGKKLQFNHLPDRCTIQIFTLVGEPVARLEHDDMTGSEFWDLRTRNDQYIAPGTYLFYATTPEGDTSRGRFQVIR